MLPFSKYSGLGNDFIFIEGPTLSKEAIIRLCDRHQGIGADGIFFYRGLDAIIFNSDGSNPSMCGNGLRCFFHHLHRIGKIPSAATVQIGEKKCKGIVRDSTVAVELGQPHIHLRNYPIEIAKKVYHVDLIDTGVPHFVVRDETFPFEQEAKTLRFHSIAPEGANVNWFLKKTVRTYERGCEQETYACGTGIAACAYSQHLHEQQPFPITLQTIQNMPLTIELINGSLWLEGKATFVFQGELNLDILTF